MNPILISPAYTVIAKDTLLAKKSSVPLDNHKALQPMSQVHRPSPLNSEPLISAFTTKVCILKPRRNKLPGTLQNMLQTNDVKTNRKRWRRFKQLLLKRLLRNKLRTHRTR